MSHEKTSFLMPGGRLPSLDGWRALSILLVLIQHSYPLPGWPVAWQWWPLVFVGGVGVRFFFVISGFIITWLMLKEIRRTNRLSLTAFYLRRSLRILPVCWAFFLVIFCLQIFRGLEIAAPAWWHALTFTVNYEGGNRIFAHLWSLGVEEQFYLIWPFIVWYFGGNQPSRLLPVLLVVIILCPLLRAIPSSFESSAIVRIALGKYSFLTICDGLAFGCVGAIGWFLSREMIQGILLRRRWLVFLLGCLGCLIPVLFWKLSWLKSLQPLQDTIQCSAFLVLMLQSLCLPQWFAYRILNVTPVVFIGLISYSMYIWQGFGALPPQFYGVQMTWLNGFPGWLLATLLYSCLSYFLIERLSLHLKARLLNQKNLLI